jgi:hypothetical protein
MKITIFGATGALGARCVSGSRSCRSSKPEAYEQVRASKDAGDGGGRVSHVAEQVSQNRVVSADQ